MPTSIPFDEGLVLGQFIEREKLERLKAVADAQSKIDVAEANFNMLLQAKRSMELTRDELAVDEIDVTEIQAAIDELIAAMGNAAKEVAKVKIEAYGPSGTLRTNLAGSSDGSTGAAADQDLGGTIDSSFESPIDFDKTTIRTLPLSSNSITLECQYFSRDSISQDARQFVAAVKAFVGVSTRIFGVRQSAKITSAVGLQVANQVEQHDIVGTLVISAVCTHENAKLMDPLVLEGDKAIRSWNAAHPGTDEIKNNTVATMREILTGEDSNDKFIDVLSGMTNGSSFVGMVHVLRSEKTESSQRMRSVSTQIQYQAKAGGWFAQTKGGFGIDGSFASDIKSLLSTLEVTSNCTVTCLGCVPSVKSSEIKIAVKAFSDFDPAKMMERLTAMANFTSGESSSLDANAEAARKGGQMMAMRKNDIQSMITGLSEVDSGKNKIIDINTMMTAFEDFVEKASAGESGVPINFYISSYKKKDIAMAWMKENFPDDLDEIFNPTETPENNESNNNNVPA